MLKDTIAYKLLGAVISYSQAGEDIIIDQIFRNRKSTVKTFLDIGANHPKIRNNTFKFYAEGASGVCVEPNPALCRTLARSRKRDRCLNIGVSTHEERETDFYIMRPDTLSTFSKEDAQKLQQEGTYRIESVIKVALKNINTILSENFSVGPDLVSIDVEGLNEEIALSIDFKRYRPKVLCLETITFSEKNEGVKLSNVIDYLTENGYFHYADTYVNSIFVDKGFTG